MGKSVSGTISFGEYVGSNVIPNAVGKVAFSEAFVDAVHRNKTPMHRQDLYSLACVCASVLAANVLFRHKDDAEKYIINFNAGLLGGAIKKGLCPENFSYWHGEIIIPISSLKNGDQMSSLLEMLRGEMCPSCPGGPNHPADILLSNVGAIFLVASIDGEFVLP